MVQASPSRTDYAAWAAESLGVEQEHNLNPGPVDRKIVGGALGAPALGEGPSGAARKFPRLPRISRPGWFVNYVHDLQMRSERPLFRRSMPIGAEALSRTRKSQGTRPLPSWTNCLICVCCSFCDHGPGGRLPSSRNGKPAAAPASKRRAQF